MKNRHAFAFFLAISSALYANSLGGDYVFDDYSTFQKKSIRKESAVELAGEYRPLRYLSLRLDEVIFGGRRWGYHLTNILLHGVASFLVFLVLRRLAGPGVALAGALLFVAHPAHTECVAYMSGRRDLLAGVFYLLGFLCWLEFSRRTRWSRWLWLAATPLLCLLALGSKEIAVTLPAVCVLHDVVLHPGLARRRLPIYVGAGAVGGILAYVVLTSGATHVPTWHGDSFGANVAISARLLVHYAALLLFPLRLLGDYSRDAWPLSRSLAEPLALLSLAAIAAGIGAAITARRRAPLVTFAVAWFVVSIAPVLQIIPFHEIAADRHVYLPSVGFCLLAGLGFERLRARAGRPVAWALLGVLLAAFAVRTVVRNRDWKDSETFWRATIATAPRCARAHFNLGIRYAQLGQSAADPDARARNLGDAASRMRRAVDLNPDYIVARVNLGRVYGMLDRNDEAREQWEEALRRARSMRVPPVDPGQIAMFLGRYDEAIEIYDDRLRRRLRPSVCLGGLVTCHKYLAIRAANAGRKEVAVPHFRKALEAAEQLLLMRPADGDLLGDMVDLARQAGDPRRAAELRARANRLGSRR